MIQMISFRVSCWDFFLGKIYPTGRFHFLAFFIDACDDVVKIVDIASAGKACDKTSILTGWDIGITPPFVKVIPAINPIYYIFIIEG